MLNPDIPLETFKTKRHLLRGLNIKIYSEAFLVSSKVDQISKIQQFTQILSQFFCYFFFFFLMKIFYNSISVKDNIELFNDYRIIIIE